MDQDIKYKKFLECVSPDLAEPRVFGVALFGLGRAGSIHLQHLLASVRVRLVYAVEDYLPRRQQVEHKYRHKLAGCKFISSDQIATVCADKEVDIAFVCTPTSTHKILSCALLDGGKHVFCEKPIAESDEDISTCYAASRRSGKKLFCAFNRRHDPGLRRIKNQLVSGTLGEVHMVKTCAKDSPMSPLSYLKSSCGIFHDCAVHDIDLVCWLMNEFPSKIQSFGSLRNPDLKELEGKDYDTVTISMYFQTGKMALIDLSRNSAFGYDQRCEVFGSKGLLVNENQRPNCVKGEHTSGGSVDPICYSFASRYEQSYQLEAEYFFDVIEGKFEQEVAEIDVLAVSKIAYACQLSAREGRVVELSW